MCSNGHFFAFIMSSFTANTYDNVKYVGLHMEQHVPQKLVNSQFKRDNKHIVAHFLDMEKNLEGFFIVQTFFTMHAPQPN